MNDSRIPIKTALMTGLLMLAGCSIFTGTEEPPPCPVVSVLPVAAEITRFVEGTGRDLIDIDYKGKINNLSGKCFFEIDSDTGEGLVRVDVRPEFFMERGPANKTRQADFDYFITLVDQQGSVLNKQVFSYSAKYWTNRYSIKEKDSKTELVIPLTGGLTGEDFSIYVGFQLSKQQVEYNRLKSGQ